MRGGFRLPFNVYSDAFPLFLPLLFGAKAESSSDDKSVKLLTSDSMFTQARLVDHLNAPLNLGLRVSSRFSQRLVREDAYPSNERGQDREVRARQGQLLLKFCEAGAGGCAWP